MADQHTTKHLDREVWSRAGLEQLARHGIDGVRIERLASELGVTKGSFYWHFKDRDDLYAAILELWRRSATLNLIRRVEQDARPEDRLRRLLQVPFAGEKADRAAEVELAVRLWGRRDERAKATLEEVDKLRLRYLQHLLEGCGFEAKVAEARAILAYSYIRVAPSMVQGQHEALTRECEALVLGRPLPDGAPRSEERGLQDSSLL